MIMLTILVTGMVSAQNYAPKNVNGITYRWNNPVVTDGTTSWTAIGDYVAGLDSYFRVPPTASLSGPRSVEERKQIRFTVATTNLVAPVTYQWRTIIGQYSDIQDGVRDTNWILSGNTLTWTAQPGFVGGDHSIVVGATGSAGGSAEATRDFEITSGLAVVRTTIANPNPQFTPHRITVIGNHENLNGRGYTTVSYGGNEYSIATYQGRQFYFISNITIVYLGSPARHNTRGEEVLIY